MKIFPTLFAASALLSAAGAAQAADLSAISPPPAPVMAAPAYSWTGGYVGLQGGYNWAHSLATYDDPALQTPFPLDPINATGFSGGIEAGFNHQFARGFVLGVEADASLANISGTIPDAAGSTLHSPGQTITSRTDYGGNLRARVGWAIDRTLFFGAAGVAVSHTTVSGTDGPISDSATLVGWTAGGGVEQALTDKVSLKAEYLYTAFGNHTWFAGQAYSSTGSSTASTVRLGLNLHF